MTFEEKVNYIIALLNRIEYADQHDDDLVITTINDMLARYDGRGVGAIISDMITAFRRQNAGSN